MEPAGSLPCSQGPAIGTYPEPAASSPQPPALFSKIYSNMISRLRLVLPSGLFPSGFCNQNTVCISQFSPQCYRPHPSHSSWSDDPNNIWWGVQDPILYTRL